MHGDHETGQDPAFLPPFIARPPAPRPAEGADRPLPPWTSERRALGGAEGEAASAPDGGWTAEAAPAGEEPWLELPEPADREQAPSEAAEEPWPGLEPASPAGPAADEPWAAVPEPDAAEEPWAMPQEPAADAEPWAAAQEEPEGEPAVLEDAAEEALVLDEPLAAEPWLAAGPASDATGEAAPWDEGLALEEPDTEAEPWSADRGADDRAEETPWEAVDRDAWDAPAVPADRPESDLPPAPASPLDELVETAGQALAGTDRAWADAPLTTWPGEAEAWQVVAAASDAAAAGPDADGDAGLVIMAEALEAIADDLRARGGTALEPDAGRDHLASALTAFLAGWRAAHRNG